MRRCSGTEPESPESNVREKHYVKEEDQSMTAGRRTKNKMNGQATAIRSKKKNETRSTNTARYDNLLWSWFVKEENGHAREVRAKTLPSRNTRNNGHANRSRLGAIRSDYRKKCTSQIASLRCKS